MKNLQLSLIQKWFDMTKTGEKKEDYREITPYWCNRFLLCNNETKSKKWWEDEYFNQMTLEERIENIELFCSFKNFDNNIMTLGYPKKNDSERILTIFNRGFDIAYGHPEWGAEPNKLYFVIKHGAIENKA